MKKVLIFLALILFVRCTQKIAGTTDETLGGNKTAAIYYANGAPAPGVTVKVFDVNDTSRIPAAQAITDNAGHYALGQVAKGTYNIWAEQDTLVAVQDSVFISPNSNTIQKDTLHASGSITAIIGMQPNDDPRSAYVQMMGSDRFSRNIDANGSFTIDGLATGTYALRISTTLPNYTPTFFTVPAISGHADTLKDTLQLVYTGIPVVMGISAVYDTVNGIVHLTWNKTLFRDFQDYLVFRDPCDSIQPSTLPIKSLTDTVFSDTIFKKNKTQGQYSFSDTNDYCFKYRICIRNNSNVQGLTYKYVALTAASPLYKIPQVKIVSSGTIYCNTPMIISAAISTKFNAIKKCEWKIGENGQYKTTSVSKPETTIVIPDTLLPYLRCIIRVTSDDGFVAYDSMDLHVLIAWENAETSQNFYPEEQEPMNEIVFNNKLLVFCGNPINIWATSDGATWNTLTNSVPFLHTATGVPLLVNFKNELWLLSDSTLWHSNDAINWDSAGTVPIGYQNTAFFTTLNNLLYIGDKSSSKGTIWASNDGLSWNILKAANGNPVTIPWLFPDTLNANNLYLLKYSTALINDTLFFSRTYPEQGTTIWKITNWEMPTLLSQYASDSNYVNQTHITTLIEYLGKLCIFDNSPAISQPVGIDNLQYFDGNAFHLASKSPDEATFYVSQNIEFRGKLYKITPHSGYWVSK